MHPKHVGQVLLAWLFTLAFCAVSLTLTFGTLGLLSRTLTPALLRFWGRTLLRLGGTRLVVEGAEHLNAETAKVATFNHGSLLDAYLVTAIMPPGSTAAIKRETMFYPFVGATLWAFGFLFIDRGQSDRAKRTLAKAAERMRRDRLTVFIAPEGTRTRDGQLLPFKKGPVHLAAACGVPIVPVVVDNAWELQPTGRLYATPGTVRIRVLPPMTVVAPERSPIDQITALRELYVRTLDEMRREREAGRMGSTT